MRNTIKLLGLCALALGVMAFAASAAQAKTDPPEWMINGVDVTLAKPLRAPIVVESLENNKAALLVQTSLAHIEIVCTNAELVGAETLPHGELTQGSAVFTGCTTLLNGTKNAKCEPNGEGDPVGTITSNEGKGVLKLVGGVPVTELTSAVKNEKGESDFANIELAEGCSVGEFTEVTGSLTAKDCKGLGETEALSHLIEEGPGTSLTAFKKEAKLVGSAVLALGGKLPAEGGHKDLNWSGLAN